MCAERAQAQLFGVAAGPEPRGVPLAPGGVPGRQELFSALGTAWDVSKSGALVHVHGDGDELLGPLPAGPCSKGGRWPPRGAQRGTHEGTQGQAPGRGTGTARGSPSPLSRGHMGQCSQCSCSHPILSEGLQRGGHPERHRPWGRDPAAPPARTQPERGPGSAARARLRLHRAPLLLLLLFPPSPEGDPGVRPRPHAPAAARGPAGPGVRGMGPPGRPRRCFGLR